MLQNFMGRLQAFVKKKFDQKGVVLIEFAFCCPALIILLFFVLDVPLAYRVVTKMQKMAELTACMIRNVPSKKDTQITIEDLKNISKATGVFLTGRLGSSKRYPFNLSTYVFCIVGKEGGFDKLWNVHIKNNLYNGTITSNSEDTTYYSKFQEASKFEDIKELANFSIREGEIKLVVETVAWYNEDQNDDKEIVSVSSGSSGSVWRTKLARLLGLKEWHANSSTATKSRGYNKNFYLLTIPGRSVGNSAKAFGNSFSVMSYVDEIIPESWEKE